MRLGVLSGNEAFVLPCGTTVPSVIASALFGDAAPYDHRDVRRRVRHARI
jgi:hypothetical protein